MGRPAAAPAAGADLHAQSRPSWPGCRPCLRAWALRPLVAVQLLAQLERPCRVSLRLRGHDVSTDQSAHQVRAGAAFMVGLPSAGRVTA